MEVILTPPLDKIQLNKMSNSSCCSSPYGIDEGELIAEILCITGELNGTCTRSTQVQSNGRKSKLITIEYDVEDPRELSS